MQLQYTPYTVPLVAALVLAVAGAAVAWKHRKSAVETWTVGLHLSVFVWVLFNLLAVSSQSLDWALLWYQLFFPCIGLVVVTTVGFVLHFVGRGEQLTRRRLALLSGYPAGIFVLSITNQYHGLMFADPTMETMGSFLVLDVTFGPAVYGIIAIGYGLVAVHTALLVVQVFRSRNVYRKLTVVFLLMVVVMTAATLPKALGVSPFPYWIFFAMAYPIVGTGTIIATTSITVAQMLPVDRLIAAVRSGSGNVVPLARNVILQEVDNGILVLDTDGHVVDINRTAKTMLGLSRPIGQLFGEIADEELARGGEKLSPILWGDAPLQEARDQVWVQTGRGERCYDVRITELTDGSGAPAGFVVLLHDITEQKESEQQLEQQRNELRTQKQQLEHQNERLDQFASIVSHDLRNPLNVAQGNVELPYSRADDETVDVEVDRLETVRSAHQRMEDIINDALALAREGKAITETKSVTLNAVAEEAWSNVETGAATLELADGGILEADRDRLLTIFENLIRNSVEHGMREDEPLTLQVGLLDDRGFYIEDDGVGISAEDHDEIFEHGHTTSADGTGLGLSIVRDIVRGHGWTITASDSDEGARFEVAEVSVHSTDTPEKTASED